MKTTIVSSLIFFQLILFSIDCKSQSKMNAVRITEGQIPASIKFTGRFIDGFTWSDKTGTNVLFLTETDPFKSKKTPENEVDCMEGCWDAELYGYHYVISEKENRLLWKVTDFVRNCPLDVIVKFREFSLCITDLNNDNLAESWFMYSTTCAGDVSPRALKLIMHEGEKKYALRGTSQSSKTMLDPENGGKMNWDDNFKNGTKDFKQNAEKLWNTYLYDYKE
jgi:hypothetical protein